MFAKYDISDKSDEGQDASSRVEMGNVNLGRYRDDTGAVSKSPRV